MNQCPNCNNDGCIAERFCDGCDQTLCDRCYKEHNAIHFDNLSPEHDRCCCDDCAEYSDCCEAIVDDGDCSECGKPVVKAVAL